MNNPGIRWKYIRKITKLRSVRSQLFHKPIARKKHQKPRKKSNPMLFASPVNIQKVTIRKCELRTVTGAIAIKRCLVYTVLKFRVDTETVRTIMVNIGDSLTRRGFHDP